MGIVLVIMAGMMSFGFKMFKDTRERMDNMQDTAEKKKEEMEMVEIPNVAGIDKNQAIMLLEANGLIIGDTVTEQNELEEGKAVKTIPEAGSKVKRGTAIVLYVSE